MKTTTAQAESVRGRAYPLPSLPTSIGQSVPYFPSLSFHFYHELFQLSFGTPSKFGGQCSGVWKKWLRLKARRLGTEGITTRSKWEGGE